MKGIALLGIALLATGQVPTTRTSTAPATKLEVSLAQDLATCALELVSQRETAAGARADAAKSLKLRADCQERQARLRAARVTDVGNLQQELATSRGETQAWKVLTYILVPLGVLGGAAVGVYVGSKL